jgi:hypothetical protein
MEFFNKTEEEVYKDEFSHTILHNQNVFDSFQKIKKSQIESLKTGGVTSLGLWVRLSTGFDTKTLGLDRYIFEKKVIGNQTINFYSQPSTNTSCCYMMNKEMGNAILKIFSQWYVTQSRPPIDFFYNLAMRRTLRRSEIVCSDFEHPPVIHGSLSGEYTSWQNEGF